MLYLRIYIKFCVLYLIAGKTPVQRCVMLKFHFFPKLNEKAEVYTQVSLSTAPAKNHVKPAIGDASHVKILNKYHFFTSDKVLQQGKLPLLLVNNFVFEGYRRLKTPFGRKFPYSFACIVNVDFFVFSYDRLILLTCCG